MQKNNKLISTSLKTLKKVSPDKKIYVHVVDESNDRLRQEYEGKVNTTHLDSSNT